MEPVLPGPEARAPPALAEHLLEEILVRIGGPADLIRASAACKAFRRLVTDAAFLRSYRFLHPPLLLSFVNRMYPLGHLPAEAPHPNAPSARAFAAAADFCYDHIPRSGSGRWTWTPYDARDGRVLLMCHDFLGVVVSPKLAMCDPLTRGYTLLPPIPDHLLDSVRVQVQDQYADFFNAFFDPSRGNEDAQFRVLCLMRCLSMAAVFVYSSVSGSWTSTSIFYDALGLNVQLEDNPIMCQHSYAYGCLYWDVGISNNMIKLDINSMESTTVSHPVDHEDQFTVVVEAGEGKVGRFSFIASFETPLPLRYSVRQNESEDAELLVEKTILLPCEYDFYQFDGAANGYIFLIGQCRYPAFFSFPKKRSAFFSLEIKTLKIEKVCSLSVPHSIIPYFGYPPFLSPRRI